MERFHSGLSLEILSQEIEYLTANLVRSLAELVPVL
jgi:hypothetical protein